MVGEAKLCSMALSNPMSQSGVIWGLCFEVVGGRFPWRSLPDRLKSQILVQMCILMLKHWDL